MTEIKFSRERANANKWTFAIPPVWRLLRRYVPLREHNGWIDPFAGMNSPAEFTNDLNPKADARWHEKAEDFVQKLHGFYDGILFDPPYSYRQVKEHYEGLGLHPTQLDTSTNFYSRVMNGICENIRTGGHAISFGWNSNGFGKRRGFEIVEIMLVAHGTHHNDTIVTVEKKIQGSLLS